MAAPSKSARTETTLKYSRPDRSRGDPAALADAYLAANPAIAESLRLFDISQAAYERALRAMSGSGHVSGDTTVAVTMDLGDLE
jgi:hypothetical protein